MYLLLLGLGAGSGAAADELTESERDFVPLHHKMYMSLRGVATFVVSANKRLEKNFKNFLSDLLSKLKITKRTAPNNMD